MVRHPANPESRDRVWRMWLFMSICLCFGMSGCAQLIHPIEAIPADMIPPQFLAAPQANKRPIDVSLLRNVAPPAYILDKEDILGVFIESILGEQDAAPPVHFPTPESDLSPGIGFPIPVRDDGAISLPLIDSIPVRGLTVSQVEELVKRRYVEQKVLVNPRVIVTLLKKRTYRVFVVRQDSNNSGAQLGLAQRTRGVFDRSDLSSRGHVLQLPAYENDILNALSKTGGLPGLNAKAEVTVLRGDNTQTEERFRQMQQTYGNDLRSNGMFNPATISGAQSTVTIPLRVAPDEVPNFRPEDVILRDGDVVYVESRETEVYYTGGLLGGGEWPIPRDYDLDVLGAVAIAGTGVGAGGPGSRGGLIGGGGNQIQATELIILRKLPGNRQIPIKVDLTDAINNPRSRLLVNKGDTLILRYSAKEEVLNFGISAFFTYGIRELFRR